MAQLAVGASAVVGAPFAACVETDKIEKLASTLFSDHLPYLRSDLVVSQIFRTGALVRIRPERPCVSACPQGHETSRKLAAVVKGMAYLRSTRTVQARSNAGQLLTARTDAPREDHDMFISARASVHWEVGDAYVLARRLP